MAHQHLGLAEIQGLAGLGELFDTLVVFENYPRRPRQPCGRCRRSASHRRQRARCHALSAEPDGGAGRAAAAAARLSARPVRARERRRRWRGGWCGCWRRRLRIPTGRSAASTFWRPRSATPSCTGGTTPRVRSRPPPCRSCSPPRSRAPPMRSRWCSRISSLSYGELDARSSQLAHHLRALGVGPETVVGLCVERSLEMVVGLLGILKAGGAYLPLDPDYPHERLAFMLEDADAPVLVTQSALLDRLPANGARIVRLDADGPAIAAQPITRARPRARSAQHRLRHLHLRLHRNPEGRGRLTWRHPQSCRRPDRSLRHRTASARAAVRLAELRCGDLGDCDGFDIGCDPDPAGCGAQRGGSGKPDPAAEGHAMRPCRRCCWRACRRTCRSRPWWWRAMPACRMWWRAGRAGGG